MINIPIGDQQNILSEGCSDRQTMMMEFLRWVIQNLAKETLVIKLENKIKKFPNYLMSQTCSQHMASLLIMILHLLQFKEQIQQCFQNLNCSQFRFQEMISKCVHVLKSLLSDQDIEKWLNNRGNQGKFWMQEHLSWMEIRFMVIIQKELMNWDCGQMES